MVERQVVVCRITCWPSQKIFDVQKFEHLYLEHGI